MLEIILKKIKRKREDKVNKMLLTRSHLLSGIATLGTLRLLNVIRTAPASSAQGVRLIVTLTKARCTLRLKKQNTSVTHSC